MLTCKACRSAAPFQTPSSLLDGELDWRLTALAPRLPQTPSSLLDGELDWRLWQSNRIVILSVMLN